MPIFDKARFAESFFAAILGAAAHDFLKNQKIDGSVEIDIFRKFQRSLIIAASHTNFDDFIAKRYKSRIVELLKDNRNRYLSITLQPSQKNFDEKMSALVIFDHAMQDDGEWGAYVSLHGLDSVSNSEMIGGIATNAMGRAVEEIIQAREKLREHNEREDSKRNRNSKGSLTFLGRINRLLGG